jgi:peptidoglycan hydrolase-like protein with peptidoglycan-binding domain
MTKLRLIIPVCVLWVAGCAVFDSTDMTTSQRAAPAPVTESNPLPNNATVAEPVVEAPMPTRRNFTRDDIRRVQLRLREVGFDPGPIDGIAGAKTRAAFVRFQTGCSSGSAVIEEWSDPAPAFRSTVVAAKIPNREETRRIQTQLRDAGFNPGPVDGIFGNRTRSLVAQLNNSCPMVSDFAQMLDQPHHATISSASAEPEPDHRRNNFRAASISSRSDSAKQPTQPQSGSSQEEVRILQLQLRDAGFDPGPFDGIMGPKTKLALQRYRASRKGKATTLISGNDGQY